MVNQGKCPKCGKPRTRPGVAQGPGLALTMLEVMERWHNDPPLQKAAFHTIRLLSGEDVKGAKRPHRP